MCDYSLHLLTSRPAKVGDKLISTSFHHTTTRGFASVDDRNVAVSLLPGTELAHIVGMIWRIRRWSFLEVDKIANSITTRLSSPTGKSSC